MPCFLGFAVFVFLTKLKSGRKGLGLDFSGGCAPSGKGRDLEFKPGSAPGFSHEQL